MPWEDLPGVWPSVSLLRRSLERGRLGHAYLFSGDDPDLLEAVARQLAATVNCVAPNQPTVDGIPTEACGSCSSCRRIRDEIHPDIHWLRAESKMRIITVDPVRELIRAAQLKPAEARYKVGILAGADRLNAEAANSFLKTLEEPPPRCLLMLLSTEPDRVIETLLSRCLRLSFPGERAPAAEEVAWLHALAAESMKPRRSLLGRYGILDVVLRRLEELRKAAEGQVNARSPSQRYGDVDPALEEQWQSEAKAAVEAEYRRRRRDALLMLQSWLRDVWLLAVHPAQTLLTLPALLESSLALARRLTPEQAVENLRILEETQRLLHTNVQEHLALEVALLKLHL